MIAKFLIFSLAALHAADRDWPVNGGPYNIRYSPSTQISPANIGKLQVAWSYDSHDAFKDSEMQSNPIVVDGMLFATTPTLKVVALDAATGREIWKFDPAEGAGPQRRYRHRGVTVYQDRVFVTWRNFLYALDKRTGRPIASFGTAGRIDLRENLGRPAASASISASSPGVIFEDMIILGSTVPETLPGTPGHIRAFDVHTGKMRWIFHTIPYPGEFGYATWPKNAYEISGGANAWAGLSIDPKLGMVFAATGSASFDFYGANRVGDNLFANCVLALDARTGRRIWHFQGVRHDVWDLDFPAAPSLVTVTRNGRPVDAVAQITKSGYVFLLDRRTGKPLFPIAYRKAPPSPLDGEKLAAEQPYPVKPPPFTRQTFDEAIITNRTPEAHAAVLDIFRKLDSQGIYTPPSGRGTILFPGTDGGGEWGGAAFDPATNLLYVNSNEQPWIIRMVTHDTASLYKNNCADCHGDDRKGSPQFPSLVDVGQRRSRAELASVIREGTGRMPGFSHLGRGVEEIVDFLVTGRDPGMAAPSAPDANWQKYRNEGYILFRDQEGYPPLTPPWGTLNAIDLAKGEIRWQIPLGEYPELVAKGLKNTGSDNYGGPVVTASGLLFIGASNFDKKFRAFDKLTGKLLWETVLPAAGNATPSIYEIDGREYVVIVCGGGKNGAPSGSAIVAFALPH
ncbi:MAG TPA: PQQ-binding-like beta-propeller repeat protein [Candidatus Sulfopaludibacter sp.]|nr:PQQ-binding-like beta-propeller repeat protein [Candidatus Sulfopaludibacter sp.]